MMMVNGLMAVIALAIHAKIVVSGELLQVVTLTRHGDRSPDIQITEACPNVFKSAKDVYKDLGAWPALLTPYGLRRMRDVGIFIGQRYISGDHFDEGQWQSNVGFVPPDYDPMIWEFTSREGNRQQMSMSAVSLGVFPNTPIPTRVTRKQDDNVLSGPPPECGKYTNEFVIQWHITRGREIVDGNATRDAVVEHLEKICGASLKGNPVNMNPAYANPHCWIGDISDTADTWYNSGAPNDPFPVSLQKKLTDLAFELEQGSHFSNKQGAIMFSGGFPLRLIESFSKFSADPKVPYPERTYKMRLHLSSREVHYGLIYLFGLKFQPPGQPMNRVISGSTFIWELHRIEDPLQPGEYFLIVKSYYWQPGQPTVTPMLHDMSLENFISTYEDYVEKHGGEWFEQCNLKNYDDVNQIHNPSYENPHYADIKERGERLRNKIQNSTFHYKVTSPEKTTKRASEEKLLINTQNNKVNAAHPETTSRPPEHNPIKSSNSTTSVLPQDSQGLGNPFLQFGLLGAIVALVLVIFCCCCRMRGRGSASYTLIR